MKLQLRAKLNADIDLPPGATAIGSDFDDIQLEISKTRNDLEVAVSKRISPEQMQEVVSIARPPREGDAGSIVFGYPKDLAKELLECLHKFESHLSFLLPYTNFDGVEWREHTAVLVAETADERASLQIFQVQVSYPGYPSERTVLTPRLLDKVVTRIRESGDVYVPLGFFREADVNFRARKYVSAFVNCYLVLEDLFGGDRPYREDAAVESFKNNPLGMHVLRQTLFQFRDRAPGDKDMRRHWKRIQAHFKETNVAIDPIGVARLLFRMRGRVSHFSRRNVATAGTPFNHNAYESIALMAKYAVNYALILHFMQEDRQRVGMPPETFDDK